MKHLDTQVKTTLLLILTIPMSHLSTTKTTQWEVGPASQIAAALHTINHVGILGAHDGK